MYIYTITSLKKHDIGHGLNRLVYVGSCKDYEVRFRIHKSDCYNEKSCKHNSKVYKIIREIGWDNFVCEVIEVMSDTTTDEELLKREQHYIDKFESKKSMNTNDVIKNLMEYKEKQKLYYANNTDKRRAYNTEYRNNNQEKMKGYYTTKKEQILKQMAEHRIQNRDRLNDLQRNRYLMKVTIRAFCNISIYE